MKTKDSATAATVLFTVIALGLALTYWLLFFVRDRLPFDPASGLAGALRGYTPTVAALATAFLVYGRRGVAEIGARFTRWRLPRSLYALALLGPLAASLLVVLAVRLLGYQLHLTEELNPVKMVLIFFVFAVVDGPIGEEIGWRGFLLPRLLERYGPLGASVIVGIVWYLWHLPLYSATGRVALTVPFLLGYAVNNVAFSVVHTWFFQRSGGSAFLAIALHTAGNYAVFLGGSLFPGLAGTPARWVYLVVLSAAGVCAGVALARQEAGSGRERPQAPGRSGG